MRTRTWASRCLVLLGLGLLAGCHAGGRTSAPQQGQSQFIKVAGPYRHAPSGMEFPTSVGEFERTAILQHDKAGLSVSARYEIDGATSKIVATVFVYPERSARRPRAPSCASGSSTARPTMSSASIAAPARPRTDETSSLDQGGVGHHGRHMAFLYEEPAAGEGLPRAAQLYLFCNASDRWQMKYVVTYPRELAAAPIIDDFMRRLSWTLLPE